MRIYGLDFTSAPGHRKPLVALQCELSEGVLRVDDSEQVTDFAGFAGFLQRPGPWVCGMDFPFGQPRDLVAALGWPESWTGYVGEVARLPKEQFEGLIRADMAQRQPGGKWRYRLADRRSDSSSAMMLFRVPVGTMFYRGATRLLASGVSVEPCRPTGETRVAVEAYPAVVVRRFLGPRPTSATAFSTRRREGPRRRPCSLWPGVRSPARGVRLRRGAGRLLEAGVYRGPFRRHPGLAALRGSDGLGLHQEGRRLGCPAGVRRGRGLDPRPGPVGRLIGSGGACVVRR